MIKCLAILTFAACLLLVAGLDVADQVEEEERYCAMVQIFAETNGRHGWPPFRGECDFGVKE